LVIWFAREIQVGAGRSGDDLRCLVQGRKSNGGEHGAGGDHVSTRVRKSLRRELSVEVEDALATAESIDV
jgi:hypothetical protein